MRRCWGRADDCSKKISIVKRKTRNTSKRKVVSMRLSGLRAARTGIDLQKFREFPSSASCSGPGKVAAGVGEWCVLRLPDGQPQSIDTLPGQPRGTSG